MLPIIKEVKQKMRAAGGFTLVELMVVLVILAILAGLAGAGLIAYTAGEMIDSDQAIQPYLPSIFHGTTYLAIALTVGVIGYGWWYNTAKGRNAKDVLVADEHAVERLEDAID